LNDDARRAALGAEVEAWIADDPDPATRDELSGLLSRERWDELEERFAGPLVFGTAGLRGELGGGPSRMNQATIARAAAGLARQLLAAEPNAATRGVVVGRDGRRMSPEFAATVAEVLVGHGLQVHWLDLPSPTPVAAFAGLHLGAAGVAIVTASHNPPQYNGFKVYGARGVQIVSPQDREIRAAADASGSVLELPRVPFETALEDGRIRPIDGEIEPAYLEALDTQCLDGTSPPAPISVVTTALHGVGHRWINLALGRRGHTAIHPVCEQAQPDGEFPTVAFPNPEEEGALDLAMALGRQVEAELIVANDPDTDRLCVAVSDSDAATGFTQLTGNELGVLLADWLLGERDRRGVLPAGALVLTTVVSTTMLERLAKAHGARYAETLTGFKWIWDRALALESEGASFVFGFEEALGYCVGPAVRDKDGVGAACALMELASAWKSRGQSLRDRLDALARVHGVHITEQISTVLPGLDGRARIEAAMASLRADPPSLVGGLRVDRARDLSGSDAEAAGLPRSDVLTYWLEGGSRLVVRPSGTEPKLKCYIEARAEVPDGGDLAATRAQAQTTADAIAAWAATKVEG
jgi:phosphomannomutase